jgi:hypothetical protein
MADKKSPALPPASWIEAQIQRAQAEGQFDNLPNAGKPMDVTGDYDPMWWVKNLLAREKLSVMPPALELRRKVEQTLERVFRMSDETEVRTTLQGLNAEIARANRTTFSGPPTTLSGVDVEAVVREWRHRRVQASRSQNAR